MRHVHCPAASAAFVAAAHGGRPCCALWCVRLAHDFASGTRVAASAVWLGWAWSGVSTCLYLGAFFCVPVLSCGVCGSLGCVGRDISLTQQCSYRSCVCYGVVTVGVASSLACLGLRPEASTCCVCCPKYAMNSLLYSAVCSCLA